MMWTFNIYITRCMSRWGRFISQVVCNVCTKNSARISNRQAHQHAISVRSVLMHILMSPSLWRLWRVKCTTSIYIYISIFIRCGRICPRGIIVTHHMHDVVCCCCCVRCKPYFLSVCICDQLDEAQGEWHFFVVTCVKLHETTWIWPFVHARFVFVRENHGNRTHSAKRLKAWKPLCLCRGLNSSSLKPCIYSGKENR